MRRGDDDRSALGARAHDVEITVGGDPRIEVAQRVHALADARDRVEHEPEQRRTDAGRELVDARIEVADDVAPVVADERPQLGLFLLIGHRKQTAREVLPPIEAAVLSLARFEPANLVERDVVEHVLEGVIAAGLGFAHTARYDSAFDLAEQPLAVRVETLEAILSFADGSVPLHG